MKYAIGVPAIILTALTLWGVIDWYAIKRRTVNR